jgi:hypothetical protein
LNGTHSGDICHPIIRAATGARAFALCGIPSPHNLQDGPEGARDGPDDGDEAGDKEIHGWFPYLVAESARTPACESMPLNIGARLDRTRSELPSARASRRLLC